MERIRHLLGWVVLGGSIAACNGLLGFEEAKLDPALERNNTPDGESADSGVGDSDRAVADSGDAATEGDALIRPPDSDAAADSEVPDALETLDGRAEAGPSGPPSCEQYCDVVMQNCSGDLEAYATIDACLGHCETFAEGVLGEAGNTRSCRYQVAQRAAGEPAVDCPNAGPYGGRVCGSPCESYCASVVQVCPQSRYADSFLDMKTCLDECSTVPDPGGFSTTYGEGDSIQCRLFHLSNAASLLEFSRYENEDFHCPHALGATPCSAETDKASSEP